MNPKIGTKLETIKREGVDIVFAIDVSKSMLAEDVAPNRIEKSKQLVTQDYQKYSDEVLAPKLDPACPSYQRLRHYCRS